MNEIVCYKPTTEDWHPSFYIGIDKVLRVTFHGKLTNYNDEKADIYRVSVWGADDCGMEYDCATDHEAWLKFQCVLMLNDVTYNSLIDMGFVSA